MDDHVDNLWLRLRSEAELFLVAEPLLAHFIRSAIVDRPRLSESLAFILAAKLASPMLPAEPLQALFVELTQAPGLNIVLSASADVTAYIDRDSACQSAIQPYLFYKGFHAMQSYRLANELWKNGRNVLALALQSRISEVFGVDIHPGATIGSGIMLDHATGLVVGETAIIEDDVSIMQSVTLGGTGKEGGLRHPVIRRGSLISAGAKILGRVEIGEGAKVGAGSVVLMDVPAHSTAVGVPAKIVRKGQEGMPAFQMDHRLT